MDPDRKLTDSARKRVSTACEACRASKVRCRPSEFPDVCQKCLELKKECVSRMLARPRRFKATHNREHPPSSSLFLGPSRTFTIDFDSPARSDLESGLELLRASHVQSLERLYPDNVEGGARDNGYDCQQWTPSETVDVRTPSTSSASSPLTFAFDGHTKPLFNLASAESLLFSFRCNKLQHLPCIALAAGESISHIAATRPFVLLAILSASASFKTSQNHGLYDNEFRRVLGLKFVVGGERSLELLQGILIYTSWYPFHIRPKDQRGYQYLRMAKDILDDLELTREIPVNVDIYTMEPTDRQLDSIRAHLTYVYVTTTHIAAWRARPTVPSGYTPSTATYCDILERNARVEGDAVLAALSRNSLMLYEAFQVTHECSHHQENHRRFILSGLATKLAEAQMTISPVVASNVHFSLQCRFIDVYLNCGSLLRLPRARRHRPDEDGSLPLLPHKLYESVMKLKALLDDLTALDEAMFAEFTMDEWVRFISTVVLSLRLSFPLPECPDFDSSWARSHLQFDEFLSCMCGDTDLTNASENFDILSASRVILGVVKANYHRQLRALEVWHEPPPGNEFGCPMFDPLLEPHLSLWDSGIKQQQLATTTVSSESQDEVTDPLSVFDDLLATIPMSLVYHD